MVDDAKDGCPKQTPRPREARCCDAARDLRPNVKKALWTCLKMEKVGYLFFDLPW
jgi:hypothetical protein